MKTSSLALGLLLATSLPSYAQYTDSITSATPTVIQYRWVNGFCLNAIGQSVPPGNCNGLPDQSQTAQPANQQQNSNLFTSLFQALSSVFGGNSKGGTAAASNGSDGSYAPASEDDGSSISTGNLEDCGQLPGSVEGALLTAMNFRKSCSLANRGSSQKVVINDYSGDGTPTMYIFDSSGKCLAKTAVTYGRGAGATTPVPCSGGSDHYTPPGFHLTAPHINGAKYNSSNSLLLVGLNGQNSSSRGILIHPAANPGTNTSWGCSGVSYNCFLSVKEMLGSGALVYNYFGNTPLARGCPTQAGYDNQSSCQLDRSAPAIPSTATGGSNGGSGGTSGVR